MASMGFCKHVISLGVILLVCWNDIQAAPRYKRQTRGFMIISNDTLPCEALQKSQGPGVPCVQLTDSEKAQVMEMAGGQIYKNFMARTSKEAAENFHSMIGIDQNIQKKILDSLSTSSKKKTPTKKDITDFMINYVYSEKHQSEAGTLDQSEDRTDQQTSQQSKTQGYKELMTFMDNIKDVENRATLLNEWIHDAHNEVDAFPLYFPEALGLQKEYIDSQGSRVQLDFCLNRGGLYADQMNLRMCTVCSSQTIFSENIWPEYVNEARCSDTDMGCLFADGLAHGVCQQVTMPVDILVKNVGRCVLALRDGQTIIAEEWQAAQQMVNVGCECSVDQNSYFANFI